MQLLYKVLLTILLLSYCTFSIELSFIASFLILPFGLKSKVDKKIFYISVFLSALLVIGVIKSFFNDALPIKFLKDFVYFSRPVLMLLSTYLIVSNIKSSRFAFDVIVSISLAMALYHLTQILFSAGISSDYSSLRNIAGKQNHVEVVGLIFLTFTPFYNKRHFKKRYLLYIIYPIILLSVIMYFSRSMYIVFLIFYLSYKGYLFFGKRLLKGFLIFAVLALGLFVVFKNIDYSKDATTTNSFSYKIYNSINEIFETVNTSRIRDNTEELWQYWRAYESQIAIENVLNSKNNIINFIFGMGFGSDIDLKTDVKLAGELYDKVPTIHNGYINIFYKTGLIGIVLYVSIFFINYLNISPRKDYNPYMKSLMIGSLFYVFYNSLVITGFLRPGEFSLVIFAIATASNKKVLLNE